MGLSLLALLAGAAEGGSNALSGIGERHERQDERKYRRAHDQQQFDAMLAATGLFPDDAATSDTPNKGEVASGRPSVASILSRAAQAPTPKLFDTAHPTMGGAGFQIDSPASLVADPSDIAPDGVAALSPNPVRGALNDAATGKHSISIGGKQYVVDPDRTPEGRRAKAALAKEQAARDAIRAERTSILRSLRTSNPQKYADLTDEMIDAAAGDNTIYHQIILPTAPVAGTPEWERMKISEAKIGSEYGYHPPQSQFSFGTAVGPDGKPVILKQNTKTGEVTPTDVGKPQAGGNSAGAAQMGAAKANMESAMQVMDAYEAKLKKDPSLFGALAATEGSLASSPTAITAQHAWDVPISLAANEAAAHLQKSNPELAKYLTAKKFMAEAILNTHKRPNQTQYEIEQEIGGVGATPSPMQIDMVASRRRRMYSELFGGEVPGAAAAPTTTASSKGDINLGASKPRLSQAQYDAGIAKGHSDAEIAQHYDLSAVQRQP